MRKAEITERFNGGFKVTIRTHLGQYITAKFAKTLEGAERIARGWNAEVVEF